jgi:hypothetical protein
VYFSLSAFLMGALGLFFESCFPVCVTENGEAGWPQVLVSHAIASFTAMWRNAVIRPKSARTAIACLHSP